MPRWPGPSLGRRNGCRAPPWSHGRWSSGAPESSNWPPGSSETAPPASRRKGRYMAPSRRSAPSRVRPACLRAGRECRLARRGRIGDGAQIGAIEGNFLVFRADAKFRRRLGAGFAPGDKLIARRNGRRIGNVAGHEKLSLICCAGGMNSAVAPERCTRDCYLFKYISSLRVLSQILREPHGRGATAPRRTAK